MYTFDTNAIIYYLKDEPIAAPLIRDILAQPAILYISAITEIELFGFPSITPEEQKQIEEILQTVVIIPIDSRVARAAASLKVKPHGVSYVSELMHAIKQTRKKPLFKILLRLPLFSGLMGL